MFVKKNLYKYYNIYNLSISKTFLIPSPHPSPLPARGRQGGEGIVRGRNLTKGTFLVK